MKRFAIALVGVLIVCLPASAGAAPVDGQPVSNSSHHNIDWD